MNKKSCCGSIAFEGLKNPRPDVDPNSYQSVSDARAKLHAAIEEFLAKGPWLPWVERHLRKLEE